MIKNSIFLISFLIVQQIISAQVNAEIEIQADGSWKILKILGRHDEAYRE